MARKCRLLLLLVASCVGWGVAYAEEGDKVGGFVLPPEAGPLLQKALGESAGPDMGLRLVNVKLDKDHVSLLFSSRGEPSTPSTVKLRHPSESKGAAGQTPAFSIHGSDLGKATLEALVARLKPLKVEDVWRLAKPAKSPVAVANSAPKKAGHGGLKKEEKGRTGLDEALHAARQAIRTGETERVSGLLAPYANQDLAVPSRVEVAALLYEGGDPAQAARLVKMITPKEHGVIPGLQASLLRGETLEAAGVIEALSGTATPCDGLGVVNLLKITGQKDEALAVAEALGKLDKPCPDALAVQVRWSLDDGHVKRADALSSKALAKHPKSSALVSTRARVLIADGRPKEAVELLETRAFADPKSVNLSSLLGAYNRVRSVEWKREKMRGMVQKAKADPGNHLAALIGGVLLHYDGQLAESNRLLNPLLNTPLNDEARLYIYLGMNAFDLGDAKTALEYIDRATKVTWPDPDVYYCRAEILRMNDPAGARDALKRYMAQTRPSPTQNTAKQERVSELLANLEQCVAQGRTTPCPGPWEHPRGEGVSLFDYRTGYDNSTKWFFVIGGFLLVGGAGLWLRRRRRSP